MKVLCSDHQRSNFTALETIFINNMPTAMGDNKWSLSNSPVSFVMVMKIGYQ